MSNSVFRVIEADDIKDSITLIVAEDGSITPNKETVTSYLNARATADINLMRMKKGEPGRVSVTLDTLTYVNSNEIEDLEDMDDIARNLFNFRMDHDYTPFTTPTHEPSHDDELEDELAHTLSMLEGGQELEEVAPPPTIEVAPPPQTYTKITKIVKGKKQTILVTNKQKAKMISTGLLKPVEDMFKKPQLPPKLVKTEPPPLAALIPPTITQIKPIVSTKQVEEDAMMDLDEEEEDDDDEADDDSDFEVDQEEILSKNTRPMRTRTKSTTIRQHARNNKKHDKIRTTTNKSNKIITEKIEPEIIKTSGVATNEVIPEISKVIEKKVITPKKDKKVIKPPDDFALFSTPDIMRRVGGKDTNNSPEKSPAKISLENRSKSHTNEQQSPDSSLDINKRRSSLDQLKPKQLINNSLLMDVINKKKLLLNEQVQVEEFSENNESIEDPMGDEDDVGGVVALPSAEDIRAIIQNENTKSFTSSLVIPDNPHTDDHLPPLPPLQPISQSMHVMKMHHQPQQHEEPEAAAATITPDEAAAVLATGLDLDQSILDNINTDLISEDILYQVAQSLVDNTELQNAIDKSIVDGVLDANLSNDELAGVDDLQASMHHHQHHHHQHHLHQQPPQDNHHILQQAHIQTHVQRSGPKMTAAGVGGGGAGAQIVTRPDGRVVILPPIERPTTRSRNKHNNKDASFDENKPAGGALTPTILNTTPNAIVGVGQSPQISSSRSMSKPLDDQHVSGNELDSSEDEEDESEDDPNKLWCICNQPHNNRFMICCDTCEEWYHGKCVNVTKAMGQMMESEGKEWICVYCRDKSLKRPNAAARRIRKASRTSTDSGGDRTLSPPKKKQPSPVGTNSAGSSSGGEKPRKIINSGCVVCGKATRSSSIYCSDVCILKHAQGVEKVVVFDRKSGRLLSGSDAPSAANLDKWLASNPSFEVVRSSTSTNKPTTPQNKPASLTQSKLRIVKNATNEGVSLAVHKKGVNIGVLSHSPKTASPTINKQPQQQPKKVQLGNITGLKIISKQVVLNQSNQSPKIKLVPASSRSQLNTTPTKPKLVQTKIITTTTTTASTNNAVNSTTPSPSSGKQPMPTKTPKARQAEVSSVAPNNRENLRDTVKKTFNEQLTTRLNANPDLKLTPEEVTKISSEIESQLYKCFGDTGQKYKNKYRSLIFNIKDVKNQTLWRRICEKSVNPYQLVRLSPDDLASQELALWREREAKHQLDMIKKSELELLNCNRQYVFKTHKGEEVFEDQEHNQRHQNKDVTEVISNMGSLDENLSAEECDSRADAKLSKDKPRNRRSSKEKRHKSRSSRRGSDKRKRSPSHSRGDDKNRRNRSRSHKTSSQSSSSSRRHKKSITSELCINTEKLDKKSKEILEQLVDKHIVPPLEDRLWKHVPQEDFLIQAPAIEESDNSDHEPSSTVTIPTPPRVLDPIEPSIVEELEEMATTPPQPPTPASAAVSNEAIWKGCISMVDVAQISITAHQVSGECLGLGQALPQSLDIVGRISPETVWEYIGKMKSSNSKTISLLRLSATNLEEKMPYLALYSYLHSRKRLGVVKSVTKAVKDFYILPLPKESELPDVLLPISGPGFEEPRSSMLLGILVRDKRKRAHHGAEVATSSSKRVRVDVVKVAPAPVAVARSYTPPPSRDPRLARLPAIDAPSPTPSPDELTLDEDEEDEDEEEEDMDEPYSPEDSDPDDPALLRLNANEISNLLTGQVKTSSFLDSVQQQSNKTQSSTTFEPFTNKYKDNNTIPGIMDQSSSSITQPPVAEDAEVKKTATPSLSNTDELQRKMAELDQRIAAQKAEIHKVSQDLVSSASSDIGTSNLANIALPSNLQQILESIKTIGSCKTDAVAAAKLQTSELTMPLLLPKLNSRTTMAPVKSTAASGSVLGSLSEEELIRKAAEMLGESELVPPAAPVVTPKRLRLEMAQPPIPGLEDLH